MKRDLARHPHHDHPAHMPSQRQLRVGEVVRHVLAGIFARGDLQDPVLREARLTVSEVRVSPDMRHASVYVTRLGGGEMKEVLEALARARGFLRHEVGQALTTRNTPDLAFIEDKSFDEAEHVLRILRSEEVKADIEKSKDENGTPQEG